ncbi:MAG: hypothetical protein JWR81_697 [Pseudonocardia sp.]|nr:hypothetical protein [Pseudonocardia sp.]MDT7618042.1 hypothetical protein [Pseudonocardiales bacterium]
MHLTLPTFGADDAARRLALWRRDGTFVVDQAPALFLYDLVEAGRVSTRGWVGAVGLPAAGVVSPHEATVPAAVADRLALLAATQADLEPIVLTFDGEPAAADELAHRYVTGPPMIDLLDGGGVRHRVWRVVDPEHVAAVRADLAGRRTVIADGHHRWASYLGHQRDRGDPGPWDRGLALLVPTGDHGPQVHAIHRVVPGLALRGAAASVSGVFRAEAVDAPPDAVALLADAHDTAVLLTDGTGWVRLTDPDRTRLLAATPERADDWRDLDVALVDVGLVEDLWDAADRVLLRHSVESAVATARETGGVAVLVRPTPAATVLDLAARGVLMPRKSTLFVPKPRTGLVLRCFADEPA